MKEDIFKKAEANFDKLRKYGFVQNNGVYQYRKKFMNDNFELIVEVDSNAKVISRVVDLNADAEYTLHNTQKSGQFVNRVREACLNELILIRDNCFDLNAFCYPQTKRVYDFIKMKYHNTPEFLWKKYPGYGVYRNSHNDKWYAIIMNIDYTKIANKKGEIEIINLKLDKNEIKNLLKQEGFYHAYHMNKDSWITIVLDDTVKDNIIFDLIAKSYDIIENS